MRLGISYSVTMAGRGRYDVLDLAQGTMSLNFVAVNEPTLQLNFVGQDYLSWDDDPAWPYGLLGIFKVKA
ncbi:hypothetical protein CF70_018030 [Cupriavidus sp. SK-3]|uniref:hypothetical protein n=1 Tax=Cupriavidus sp. SK-3 TaxID=1470558 RepID=UPI00044B4BD8|nr:hypothetical protein [Cupriavidus sp. SK-3]KDP84717.1 hypothetical protein CF70_018030 [Cupriavidus sp. SK-3]